MSSASRSLRPPRDSDGFPENVTRDVRPAGLRKKYPHRRVVDRLIEHLVAGPSLSTTRVGDQGLRARQILRDRGQKPLLAVLRHCRRPAHHVEFCPDAGAGGLTAAWIGRKDSSTLVVVDEALDAQRS